MPLVKTERPDSKGGWGIPVLAATGVCFGFGAFGNHLWRSSTPVFLGPVALTGPKCWVEEPVPYIYVSGRQPGKMDEFAVRFRIGELGFYTRKN